MVEDGDPRPVFDYALANWPQLLQVTVLGDLVTEAARGNDKRPAYMKLAVPDEMVKNLRGDEKQRDLVLVIRIPNEVVQRSKRLIVLPGEVA